MFYHKHTFLLIIFTLLFNYFGLKEAVMLKPAEPVFVGAAGNRYTLPEATNLVRNGDFNAGEDEWNFWGQIGHSVVAGALEIYRETTSPDGASVFQAMGYTVPAGSPLEASLQLGNSSIVPKEIWVTARNSDWSSVMTCYFTLPPGTSPGTYTLRGETSTDWDNIWLEIAPGPADSIAAITVDNVSLQYQPDLLVTGVECNAPSTATDPTVEVPTTAPASETPSPTAASPVHVPDSLQEPTLTNAPLQTVESDAFAVQSEGTWHYYATDAASGGGYLYNSGSVADMLSLVFLGTRVEVIYVQHPALGRFTVHVDGVPRDQRDSSGPQAFKRIIIDGLAAGDHIVQVIPEEGHAIALDAFAVANPVLLTPPPPPTPIE